MQPDTAFLFLGAYPDGTQMAPARKGAKRSMHRIPNDMQFRTKLCDILGRGEDQSLLSCLHGKTWKKDLDFHQLSCLVEVNRWGCNAVDEDKLTQPTGPESTLQMRYYGNPLDAYERTRGPWEDIVDV
jgi:hypothetical protein